MYNNSPHTSGIPEAIFLFYPTKRRHERNERCETKDKMMKKCILQFEFSFGKIHPHQDRARGPASVRVIE